MKDFISVKPGIEDCSDEDSTLSCKKEDKEVTNDSETPTIQRCLFTKCKKIPEEIDYEKEIDNRSNNHDLELSEDYSNSEGSYNKNVGIYS